MATAVRTASTVRTAPRSMGTFLAEQHHSTLLEHGLQPAS